MKLSLAETSEQESWTVPSGTDQIDILMYHSIARGKGPTSMPPEIFRSQMEELERQNRPIVSLARVLAWHRGDIGLPPNAVALTFDDGFVDFAKNAFPLLHKRGWPATVFLPTAKVGGKEDWAKGCGRLLLDWPMVKALSQGGIDFGGHGTTHADLTKLSDGELENEIRTSFEDLSDMLGKSPISFAQPYGKSNAKICLMIGQYYQLSAGTLLNQACQSDDLFELPRIEMHYFRNPKDWRGYLDGSDKLYFRTRRTLKAVRNMITGN